MSELSRRIQDRTPRRPPLLSESLALAVEQERLSYAEALIERERIILRVAELERQRSAIYTANERLEDENAALRAKLTTAEQAHTIWLAGLAVATLATVIVALSIIR